MSVAQKLLAWLALGCACCACTDSAPAAPPIDPDDVDGDGIPNARDLCPEVADPAQHDEDGDGLGDFCDVCPTVSDPAQLDQGELDAISFNDGVGDACDPRPSTGGDRIGALHTFAVASATAWIGAGWTIGDDRARAGDAARWLGAGAVTGDAVTARLAVESVAWAVAGGAVSVALDGDGLGSARACALVADRNGDGGDELEVRELGGAVAVRELAGAALGPLTLIVQRGVDRRTATGVIHCLAVFPDRPDAPIKISIPTSDDTTTGQYVIAAASAEVVATSLVVYGSPVACPTTAATACNRP